ncbi:MAG: 30S ribosomal protein S21 [Clostridia bacterium]|jgi:small subunit ribosomal protein S21|nr:30S ribosomal protein S21 [Clostridia bacterium]MBP3389661.1 30S ribosomal protein S21 [Clostridia bacterium]MBQ2713526.1 30S ribosomal protein S21 [Clostridia bacterium]MBR2052732.1 30S ribosomal protein S21 [Clostridia bacterium]MBR2220801.1 30S ribosomal protein S21 [Clostridia bacterium]
MTMVKVGENESVESAIKRFKRKCQKDGIIGDIRRKEAYYKPSVAKKMKSEAARKKARKRGN